MVTTVPAINPQSVNFITTYASEISLFGTVATIIGLGLSTYLVITARRINRFIFFSKRLPQLHKKIKDHASIISHLLNNFEDSREEICTEMTRCLANLKALRKGLPWNRRNDIKQLSNSITSKLSNNSMAKEDVREVYLKLQYIVTDIMNIQIDHKWEK